MKRIIALGITVLIILTAIAGCGNSSKEQNGGTNIPTMLTTKARVIEVYSLRSVLVEIIAEVSVTDGEELALTERANEYDFLAGEKVHVEFPSDATLLSECNTDDIIYILRPETYKIDFSKEPIIAQCYSVNRIESIE